MLTTSFKKTLNAIIMVIFSLVRQPLFRKGLNISRGNTSTRGTTTLQYKMLGSDVEEAAPQKLDHMSWNVTHPRNDY